MTNEKFTVKDANGKEIELETDRTLPQWFVSFTVFRTSEDQPDDGSLDGVVIVHSCCDNHAVFDAAIVASFPHGRALPQGPFAPNQWDTDKTYKWFDAAHVSEVGGVREKEAMELIQEKMNNGRVN